MLPLLQREILLTKEKFQAQGITFLVLKIENPKQPTYHFQRCNTTKGCSSSFISFWVALIFDQLCVCVCHPFLTTVVLLLIHLLFHHNFLWLFLSFGGCTCTSVIAGNFLALTKGKMIPTSIWEFLQFSFFICKNIEVYKPLAKMIIVFGKKKAYKWDHCYS